MNFLKKHADAATTISVIIAGAIWMHSQFTDIENKIGDLDKRISTLDNRLTKIETVMILQGTCKEVFSCRENDESGRNE